MAYCPKCATEVESTKFCTTCGSNVLGSSAEATSLQADTKSKKAMWVHLTPMIMIALTPITIGISMLLLWLPALIIRKTSDRNSLENRHATSALNYHLTTWIAILGTAVLVVVVGLLASLAGAGGALIFVIPIVCFGILTIGGVALRSYISGSIAGARGKEYSYPLTYAFVK
ncbi:MAG: DUF4870 domain-containing protein [Microbacteriaceae bacterium]|nr:DUF4870 domain-containing protein [Microbacteriaceae bacterium]